MAKRTQIVLVDDIDGSSATQSIRFSLEGTSYEIDLNDANAADLRTDFSKWVGHATKVSGSSGATKRTSRRNNTSAVREWANANGFKVSSRGRVPAEVKEAYDRAH
ncbi:histone-like nucleoid-structuring protein Lsr2 [Aestuariimicrobium ganziense]|uniref:histone-like nucleoid-structuring protein Lsr2 n=1 Tax=Aestuariimicrobium ganziense TaxID=2773677 RepID=UPI001945A5F2|nr:Lsr2 family protein [Aestuariimicrobium ganziense]